MFELASKAKDLITGFTGTITGMVRDITGCDQYLISPSVDKEGKHVEARWVDDNRVVILEGKKKKVRKQKYPGAGEPAPIK